MNTFNFNNRETYLAFRAAWKKEYNELSQEIRNLKATWAEEIRSGQGGYTHYAVFRKRREATAMMQLLEEAKLESARQWTASREGVVA
jgi:hypothetical protein